MALSFMNHQDGRNCSTAENAAEISRSLSASDNSSTNRNQITWRFGGAATTRGSTPPMPIARK